MSKRFQRDKDRKIADIQSAFTELINTTGYDKVTIRQIAKKAGISVGIITITTPRENPPSPQPYTKKISSTPSDPTP